MKSYNSFKKYKVRSEYIIIYVVASHNAVVTVWCTRTKYLRTLSTCGLVTGTTYNGSFVYVYAQLCRLYILTASTI